MKLGKRKCKNCGCIFQKTQPLQFVCTIKCSIQYSKKQQEIKEQKGWKQRKKVLAENTKKRTDYEDDLQTVVNSIIRIIDNGYPCIATGAQTGKRNAGHYVSRGSNATLRYNLFNIYIQSEHSNNFKGGDNIRYADGLKATFGRKHFDYVESLRAIYNAPLKMSIDELKEKIILAKSIEKQLLNEGRIYSPKERLTKRSWAQSELKIYLDIYYIE